MFLIYALPQIDSTVLLLLLVVINFSWLRVGEAVHGALFRVLSFIVFHSIPSFFVVVVIINSLENIYLLTKDN